MSIKEMTHTAHRCRLSEYREVKGDNLFCTLTNTLCPIWRADECENWQPSEIAVQYFSNKTKGTLYRTLTEIYSERVKRNAF